MQIVCPSCASEYMIDPARIGAEGRTVRCASCRGTWFVPPLAQAAPAPGEAPLGPEPSMPDVPALDPPAAAMPPEATPPQSAPPQAPEAETPVAAEPTQEMTSPTVRDEAQPASDGEDAEQAARPAADTSPQAFFAQRRAQLARLAAEPRPRRRWALAPWLLAACLVLAAGVLWQRGRVVERLPQTARLYAAIGLPVNLRGLELRGVRSELVTVAPESFLVVEGEIANITGRPAGVPPIEIAVRGGEGQMLYTWSNDAPRQTLEPGESTRFRARLASPPAEARQVLVHFGRPRTGVASRTP